MKTYLLFLILLIVSCEELTGEKTDVNDVPLGQLVGGLSFTELDEEKVLLDGTMNSGEAHSFKIKFLLPEGQSLRFFVYSNRNLANGLIIKFSRVGGKTFLNFTLNGVSDTRELADMGEEIDLVLDVHNDHEDLHILLWNSDGPFNDAEECVEDGGCLYNSEFYTFPNEGPWGSQGRASGVFWGIQGDKSLILNLEGPLKAVSDA